MTDREALILLNMVEGLGPKKIEKILSSLDKPSDIFTARKEVLDSILGQGLSLGVISKRDSSEFSKELKLIEREKIDILTILDGDYPALLKEIYDAPAVLYLKGQRSSLRGSCIGIVGSRRASFYGLNSSERLSYALACLGLTVVSGLARGIDTCAHKGALKADGLTVAVLGSGLLNIYPSENKGLAREICLKGCLVSEFPLTMSPLRQNFPRRNRIISGLSRGVLVVEAAKRSGALITANFALEQNREVFCLPGKIDSIQSKGTNSLIKQGAKLVDSVEDIFEELGLELKNTLPGSSDSLSSEEKRIYDIVSSEDKDIEAIARSCGLARPKLYQALVSLELKKLIKELPGKVYARR
ncbi:MAG: DNA-processing protein DprA [Candidatus Omnitrophica bacterium]|nr:DNA-processing protein DprA [Candidatus Omnitrophota bacterium]